MAGETHKVAVVVSADAAASLATLARRCPVWVIGMPETEATAQDARRLGGDVTVFSADVDPEASLLSIIDEVELHHGAESYDPTVSVIEVLGTSPTDAIRERFRSLGFSQLDPAPNGFVARRT